MFQAKREAHRALIASSRVCSCLPLSLSESRDNALTNLGILELEESLHVGDEILIHAHQWLDDRHTWQFGFVDRLVVDLFMQPSLAVGVHRSIGRENMN